MKVNRFFQFSKEEILLAMDFVAEAILNSTKSDVENENGIYLDIESSIRYLPFYKVEMLIKMLEKYEPYNIYKNQQEKMLDMITEK